MDLDKKSNHKSQWVAEREEESFDGKLIMTRSRREDVPGGEIQVGRFKFQVLVHFQILSNCFRLRQ